MKSRISSLEERLDFKFLASIDTPILLVGNGVLPFDLTEFEHHFRSIIRINNFSRDQPYPKRVTHWVVNTYLDIAQRQDWGKHGEGYEDGMQLMSVLNHVFVPWTQYLPVSKYTRQFCERTGHRPIFAHNDNHIIRYFPHAMLKQWGFPSTGFCMFAWLMHYFGHNNVKAVGFDGFKTGHCLFPSNEMGHKITRGKEFEYMKEARVVCSSPEALLFHINQEQSKHEST